MSEHVKELKIQLDIEQTRSFELADEIKALQAQLVEAHVDYKTQVNAIVECHDQIEALQAWLDAEKPYVQHLTWCWLEMDDLGETPKCDCGLTAALKQEKG